MRRLEIVLVGFVIAVWIVFAPMWVSFQIELNRALGPQPWPKQPIVTLELPDGGSKLIFNMRSTHPIKPQFDRRISVVLPDGRILKSKIVFQYRDPTNIALYWYRGVPPNGPLLRLETKSRQIVVNIGEGWIDGMARSGGKLRMAPPYGSYNNDWVYAGNGMIEIVDLESQRVIRKYREREVPGLLKQSKGRFLGRIYGHGIRPEFLGPAKSRIEVPGD